MQMLNTTKEMSNYMTSSDVKQSMVIYKLTNKLNGKVYIGKTEIEFRLRLNQHRSNSLNPNSKNYNNYIYRAIRKYGWENFTWEIIDNAKTESELIDKEIYWIKYFGSFGNGYNMTEGGEGIRGYVHGEEMREQIAISHGSKPFHLFDFEGNLVQTYLSKIQCERETGLWRACIVNALSNKQAYCGEYILVYEEEYGIYGDDLICNKIERAKNTRKGSNIPQAILNEEIVKEIMQKLALGKYTHKKIAQIYGISRGMVGSIARGRNWTHVLVKGFEPKLTKFSKLGINDVIEIKKSIVAGEHHKKIAARFNISTPNVSSIATGNTWSEVEVEGFRPVVRKGGELSPTAKLSKNIVLEIKRLLNCGEVAIRIAEHFNINKSAVYDIKQGRTWKSVDVYSGN